MAKNKLNKLTVKSWICTGVDLVVAVSEMNNEPRPTSEQIFRCLEQYDSPLSGMVSGVLIGKGYGLKEILSVEEELAELEEEVVIKQMNKHLNWLTHVEEQRELNKQLAKQKAKQ